MCQDHPDTVRRIFAAVAVRDADGVLQRFAPDLVIREAARLLDSGTSRDLSAAKAIGRCVRRRPLIAWGGHGRSAMGFAGCDPMLST
jgi:ketosteroid isomerase-like protein